MNDPAAMADVLRSARTIAVVGLTDNRLRPAYHVAHYLIEAGYDIIPVGPSRKVHGVRAYATLLDVPRPVDIVNIFRRSDRVGPHIDEAIAAHARCVWLQLRIRDQAAEQRAEQAGLIVVADRCTQIEHARLRAAGLLTSAVR